MLEWVGFVILAGAVIATVILPLMQAGRTAPARSRFDRAVYRDQLREVERERERGLLTETEAAAARLEIERRLLGSAAEEERDRSATGPARGSLALIVALGLAVPIGAAAIYLFHGSPQLPDQPYWARAAERALVEANGALDLDKTASALEAKLKDDPANAEGWLLLARTQAARGRWTDSAAAYHQALALTQQRPDVAAAYGEMLVMAADGMVTPPARDAFAMALARDPRSVPARYYLALSDAQAGDAPAAIEAWQRLLAEAPADAPWAPSVKARIAETAKAAGLPMPPPPAPAARDSAGGPSTDDVAAAAQMTPEARAQMVRGMVERLAARLKSQPGDLDGWLRLARAYEVLDETDKAADAYAHAAALKPGDVAILGREVDAQLAHRAASDPIPEGTLAVLKQIEAADPDAPRALWYLGLAAAQAHRIPEAQSYWQRLLAELPPESEEHKTVSDALAAITGQK